MKKIILSIIKKSKYVRIEPDQIDGIPVTRLVIKEKDIFKISDWIWFLCKLLDEVTGKYGYRVTIDCGGREIRFRVS